LLKDWSNSELLDTVRMNSLKDLIFDHYCYENPDSAISLSEELALKASESAHIEWLGHSHNLRGIAMNVKGEIAQSMNHYETALKIYLEIDDRKSQAAVMNNMANIFQDQGNQVRALEYYEKSLEIDESIGGSLGMAVTLMNIGIVHLAQGHAENTLQFFLQGLKIVDDQKLENMRGPVLNNLASVYHSMGMTDSAIVYFERSLKIRRDNEDAYGTARVLDNMGEVLLSVGDTNEALKSHLEALSINQSKGYKENLPGNYEQLGRIQFFRKNYKQTQLYGDSSLALGKEMGNVNHIRDAAKLLSEVYDAQSKSNILPTEITIENLK